MKKNNTFFIFGGSWGGPYVKKTQTRQMKAAQRAGLLITTLRNCKFKGEDEDVMRNRFFQTASLTWTTCQGHSEFGLNASNEKCTMHGYVEYYLGYNITTFFGEGRHRHIRRVIKI